MNDKFQMKKAPLQFYEVDNMIHSNVCIWCGELGPMSKSHLFPDSIGGSFVTYTSCDSCNNFLGTRVESKVLDCGLIASGLVKCNIATQQKAYGRANKFDARSGRPVLFNKKGDIEFKPEKKDKSNFSGSKEANFAFLKKRFERDGLETDIKAIREFVFDDNRTQQQFKGVFLEKSNQMRLDGEIVFDMTQEIDQFTIFKIAYEFLILHAIIKNKNVFEALSDLVSIDPDDKSNRIILSPKIIDRVFDNSNVLYDRFRNKEEIPFIPVHYVILRLSVNGVLYLEIVLFGAIRCFFVIDEVENLDSETLIHLNWVRVYQIGKPSPSTLYYPNVDLREMQLKGDQSSELRFKFMKARKTV